MSRRIVIPLVLLSGLSPQLLRAQSYRSLKDKVQLFTGNTNVAAVVKSLQQQTSYTFIYDPEYLRKCTLQEIKFPGTPLGEVLSYIDNNTPLDVELTPDNIIALRKGTQERQTGRSSGRIAGKVVDGKNEPLPGVTVMLPGGQGTTTSVDGTYELALAPGTYSLTFSFISFESRKITDVIVKEKGITPLDVVMKSSGSRLKEVTVTANYRKASVEGLYALQKNNPSITDGISAEQIARTPDKNTGEVLKRVSGLATVDNKYVVVRGLSERYNQAVLNGQVMPSTELNRKNFSFDIIPSNMIENITVVKTITPDRSAEFGGGLVEVNTLDIPTENFLNISAGLSYNDKTTGKDFLSLPLSGSEYYGKVAKNRFLLGTLDWKDRSDIVDKFNNEGKNAPNQFSNNWGITKFNAPVSPNYQAGFGHVFRLGGGRQLGVIASASYRNTMATQDVILGRDGFHELAGSATNSMIFKGSRYGLTTNLGGMIGVGYRTEKSRLAFQSMYLRTLDQQFILGVGANDKGPNTLGLYDLAMQTTLWQNQLRGEHAIGQKGIKLKWMGSYLKLDRQKPDNHLLLAEEVKQVEGAPKNGYNIRNVTSNFSEGAVRWWSRALENNYNWDVSLSVPFKFNAGNVFLNNTLKAGYAGWSKDRLFFVVNATTNFENHSQNYIPLAQAFTPEHNVSVSVSPFGDNFKKRTAALHAMYAMLDNKIGDKFRLVWGLRAEFYNLNKVNDNLDSTVAKFSRSGQGLDFSDLMNKEPNWRFFPSANLTYSLTPSMNLRLAYSESIIRPDLRDLSYFREYDFELGGMYLGNIVRSTTIRHYDFRYEWYPGPGEILSASLFYKHLSYPMEIYQEDLNKLFELKNSKSAKNYGIELEMRKSLRFTTVPVLRDITLYANFTYLDASVKPMLTEIGLDSVNPKRVVMKEKVEKEVKRPQMGASNFMFNAGIYYDKQYLFASLLYNSVTNRVYLPNAAYQLSLMERPLQSMDAQVGVRLLKNKAEIKLNVANILNSYAVIYRKSFTQAETEDIRNGKAPGKSQMNYKSGVDLLNYKASPGRTYSATVSYRF
jgi:hypothetical protein